MTHIPKTIHELEGDEYADAMKAWNEIQNAEAPPSALNGVYSLNATYKIYKLSNRYKTVHWYEGVQVRMKRNGEIHLRFERWWDGVGKPDERVAKPFIDFLNRNEKHFKAVEGHNEFFGTSYIYIEPIEKDVQ